MQQLIPKLRFPEFEGNWEKKKVGEVTDYVKGFAFKSEFYSNKGVRIIRVSDLSARSIKNDNDKIYIKVEKTKELNKYNINKGDIIITTVGSKPDLLESAVGRGIFVKNPNEGLLNQNLLKFNYSEKVDNGFLFGYINSEKYISHIKEIKRGNANQSNITVVDLLKYEIFHPTIQEQTKIASFLTAVDDKLQALKQKKTLLEQYKKGVMKQIFSQELRFKDDNGHEYSDWEEKMLGDIVKEYNVKSIVNDQYVVLSSSMGGIKLQSDYFTKDVSSKDNTGYKIVPKGYFTYRSMSDTGSFTFNIQNIVDIGIVSPAYPVFKTLDSIVSEYLSFYLNKSNKIINDLLGLKEGGTRYALSFSKFSRLEVILPSFQEQTKIANFLSAIDDKINHCQEQIVNTEVWKKGLLQQMFV